MAIGCYTPAYLPASFKGVPFDALEATYEYGRRGAEGEFPFSDTTAYVDLGRKSSWFTGVTIASNGAIEMGQIMPFSSLYNSTAEAMIRLIPMP